MLTILGIAFRSVLDAVTAAAAAAADDGEFVAFVVSKRNAVHDADDGQHQQQQPRANGEGNALHFACLFVYLPRISSPLRSILQNNNKADISF